MFKIVPIQDKSRQKAVCDLVNSTYREDCFAYEMIDNETEDLMAMSQFEILGKNGIIYDIKSVSTLNDYEAMFILGRQTMNFIDLCGAHFCTASIGAGEEKLLHAIGFRKKDDGVLFVDMSGMFDGKCR